jgi:hypothetical protein
MGQLITSEPSYRRDYCRPCHVVDDPDDFSAFPPNRCKDDRGYPDRGKRLRRHRDCLREAHSADIGIDKCAEAWRCRGHAKTRARYMADAATRSTTAVATNPAGALWLIVLRGYLLIAASLVLARIAMLTIGNG